MVQRLGTVAGMNFFKDPKGVRILFFRPFFWGELMVLMVFYQKEIKLCEFFWSSSFFFWNHDSQAELDLQVDENQAPKKTSIQRPDQNHPDILTEPMIHKLDFFYQWFNRSFFVKKGHMNFLISKWWLIWISNLPHSAKQGDATHEFLRSIFLNHFFSMKDL